MLEKEIERLSEKIIIKACESKSIISTAESCTGGLIGSSITSIPGSSSAYDRGFITYSNQSKCDLFDIDMELINKYGAVSKEIAILMAEGALKFSKATITASVTGVAGPGGGTKINPVGRVHMGIAIKNKKTKHSCFTFEDKGRNSIRKLTTLKALEGLYENI